MPAEPTLLCVPNVSEGRDEQAIDAIAAAFTSSRQAGLLDVHRDPDHHRSVFTLAGEPGKLAEAVLAGAREAVARVNLEDHDGVHPRVGALDVVPMVHLDDDRGAACAAALVVADLLGQELGLPVFLYGALAGGRTRAELRRTAWPEPPPDFGPAQPHPTAGATLVGARPPLVAFNVELRPPATEEEAKRIAAAVRAELPDVRALGLWLASRDVAQVSFNVEDPHTTPLRAVVEAVRRHAPIAQAELVGLAPSAALEGFPEDVPLPGFDPSRHVLENALSS